jgi:hypothetical protein
MPDHLSVGIYNAAGELVKTVYSGSSQASPGGFSLSGGAFVPLSGSVAVQFSGLLQNGQQSVSWDGTNNAGQAVSGGTYYVKAQMTDSFGTVQTWIQGVTVLPRPATQILEIFNSAGEMVATLGSPALSGKQITSLGFPSASHAAFSLGSGGGGVALLVGDSQGGTTTLNWDGKTSSGAQASSGSYIVEVVDDDASHGVVMSKGFEVLDSPLGQGFSPIAVPNPLGPQDQRLSISLGGTLPAGQSSVVTLYNLAGELVAQGVAGSGSGLIILSIGRWSSGIYVADVELRSGSAVLSRKLLKIAIQH